MASIQGVYVALFGRPADPTGLAFFNTATNNGGDLTAIGDLSSTKEYKDRFDGQSNLQIVRSIYQSLFNRDPEPTGLNFFVDALNKGTLNINNIAIAILDGAQGSDKTTVDNKIKSADLFTAAIDTPAEIAAYTGNAAAAAGRAYLANVTTTAKTAAQAADAVKAVEVIGTGGVSLTVATGVTDAISPTATDAKFKTTGGDDTITITGGNPGGKIDGGFGVDALRFSTGGNFAPAADVITNIEKLFVTVTGAHAVTLTDVAGLKEVWNEKSTATFAATGIASGATLGVNENGAFASSFTFKDAQTGTTNVVLAKAQNALTVINGAETVALSTSGGSTVSAYTDASVKALNISGSGNLTLATAAATNKLATVDASALTGGSLNLDASLTAQKLTITGSKQADVIKVDVANGVADTIVYKQGEASTFVTFETVEGLVLTGANQDKIDLKDFALTKTGGVTLFNNAIENASFGTNSVAKAQDATVAGDSWVFIDTNGDGKLNLATDFAVKLIGVAVANIDVADFAFA